MWTSSFERGLRELIGIWRGLRNRLPLSSRLLIAGGAQVYREYGGSLAAREEMLREETAGDRDIEWLGPLGPRDLFAVLSKAGRSRLPPRRTSVAASGTVSTSTAAPMSAAPVIKKSGQSIRGRSPRRSRGSGAKKASPAFEGA